MTLTDVFQAALFTALFVFLVLCGASLPRMLARRRKGVKWREILPGPGRFLAIRGAVALGTGALVFILITAALILNQHRPPEEPSPVINVGGSAGPIEVTVDLNDCEEPATGLVEIGGITRRSVAVTIRTGSGSPQPVPLNRNGVGRFTLDDATSGNGVLSCYLPLPIVEGGTGTTVMLKLGDAMEVDTLTSVPGPAGYRDGTWIWDFEPGERTGALASLRLAFEEGARQVIVLVLAAIVGAIIALFIGEMLIEPVRRRLDRPKRN